MTRYNNIKKYVSLAVIAAIGAVVHSAPAGEVCADWNITPVGLPENADRAIVRDIHAIGPDDIWAVGDYRALVNGINQYFAFTMHNDGSGWSYIPTPQPTECAQCYNVALYGIDATGPNDVWAAGGAKIQAPDGFLGTHILVMHWDGSEWTVMDTPVQTGASGDFIWDVQAIAPDNVWFFGENLYDDSIVNDLGIAMHWDGSDFTFIDLPIVNDNSGGFGNGNSLRAGSALSPNDIWAVGAAADGDWLACGVWQIHHWNGLDWQHVPADNVTLNCAWHALNAVVAIATDDVWVGGEYFDGSYHGLALHWDGNTWTQVAVPGSITDFVAFGPDDIYASGGGIMHWDGTSWSAAETFPDVLGPSLAGITAVGACDIWAGGRELSDPDFDLLPFIVHSTPEESIPGDIDGDGSVNVQDLLALLGAWGSCDDSSCPADIDGNEEVHVGDLLILLANWG